MCYSVMAKLIMISQINDNNWPQYGLMKLHLLPSLMHLLLVSDNLNDKNLLVLWPFFPMEISLLILLHCKKLIRFI